MYTAQRSDLVQTLHRLLPLMIHRWGLLLAVSGFKQSFSFCATLHLNPTLFSAPFFFQSTAVILVQWLLKVKCFQIGKYCMQLVVFLSLTRSYRNPFFELDNLHGFTSDAAYLTLKMGSRTTNILCSWTQFTSKWTKFMDKIGGSLQNTNLSRQGEVKKIIIISAPLQFESPFVFLWGQ